MRNTYTTQSTSTIHVHLYHSTKCVCHSTKCTFHTIKMWWRPGNEVRYVHVSRSFPCSFSQLKETRCISDPKGQLNLFPICRVLDCFSLSLSHADCVGSSAYWPVCCVSLGWSVWLAIKFKDIKLTTELNSKTFETVSNRSSFMIFNHQGSIHDVR